jgi:CBS domain-containing protein
MDDRAAFLHAHPPFDTLDAEALAEVAATAEPRAHRAGATILGQAARAPAFAYVIRSGTVELVVGGRVLDLLGEGEMFGYAAMLADLPLGFTARAAEDVVLYRIPERALRPVLERPEALRFVARALAQGVALFERRDRLAPPEAGGRAVRDLVRAPPILCEPSTTVREAARRMVQAGATCVLVDLGATVGIVTDHDLRTRVVAAGAGAVTPLSAVMSAPARTVAADRSGDDALLEMLDHGVRHLPVVDAHRRVLGVVDDIDLMASERRDPFHTRMRIARAEDAAAVAAAAAALPQTVIALHDAGVNAPTISRVIASIHDSATRRLIDIAHRDLDVPAVPFAWLALGSYGRREPYPGSDGDSALAWQGADDDPRPRRGLAALGERVVAGLSASGIRPCPDGVIASNPAFARSVRGWERAAGSWQRDPDRGRGLMLLSVAVESAPVWGSEEVAAHLAAALRRTRRHPDTVRRMAIAALTRRPPTGFIRQFVLEESGARKGLLDIKRGGLAPIVDLARWSGMVAGVTAASTVARLDAAEADGTLSAHDAAVLRDAFALVSALRMEHHVERLRAGLAPDDLVDPTRLTQLTRSSLREAFRAVAAVQRGVATGLGLSPR